MRLICPNCDAQYEVLAALIPASGRDVQCSNCGKTWFQEAEQPVVVAAEPEVETAGASEAPAEAHSGDGLGAEAAAFFSGEGKPPNDLVDEAPRAEDSVQHAVASEFAPADERVAEAEPEPVATEPVAAHDPEPEQEPEQPERVFAEPEVEGAAPEPEPEPVAPVAEDLADEEFEEDPEAAPQSSREPERQELDAAVLGILRAEAEREIAARRAEAEAMESQPELGLTEPEVEEDPIGARTRRLRGIDDEDAQETAAVAVDNPARKALLPDVEEINSTLTANSDRSAPLPIEPEVKPEVARSRRSGFRLGFSLVLLVTAVLILAYLFAPELSAQFPEYEPWLAAYVDWANGVRQTVDSTLQSSISALTEFLVELSS